MVKEILIALDQLVNTLLAGWADETLSARCWRLRHIQPFTTMQAVIDGLFFLQDSHCESSYQSEVLRTQLPPEYRS